MNMPRAEAGARLLPLLLLAAYSLAAVQALTLAGDQLKDFIQIADREEHGKVLHRCHQVWKGQARAAWP